MKKSTLKILSGSAILSLLLIFFFNSSPKKEDKNSLASQRAELKKHIDNSPFQETLTWDKKKRKNKGLPPNKYFEQMWELTINPSTGRLDDGGLTQIREEALQNRMAQRNPGDASNAWEERGPNNVGGRTRVIIFDPNDSSNNTVYAGGVSGGLWKKQQYYKFVFNLV